MFWKRKSDSSPLGVPLGDLLQLLKATSFKSSLDGSTLTVRHEQYTVRTEVISPETRNSANGPIRAVVRITAELPHRLVEFFKHPEATVTMNRFAALGALTADRGKIYIGSRLTIYKEEDAWQKLQLPLLFFAIICAAESILGGMRRASTNEGRRGGESEWTEDDFTRVESYLSRICLCTTGGLGLTAEFGLTPGATSALAGDQTALFQMMADQPHPELGGGLFCLLQMPHQFPDQKRLQQVCAQLNRLEMAADDLPPHFGAWCEGKLGNNPAYVSFLPNALHTVSGIAVNAAYWASSRTQWANPKLASLCQSSD